MSPTAAMTIPEPFRLLLYLLGIMAFVFTDAELLERELKARKLLGA